MTLSKTLRLRDSHDARLFQPFLASLLMIGTVFNSQMSSQTVDEPTYDISQSASVGTTRCGDTMASVHLLTAKRIHVNENGKDMFEVTYRVRAVNVGTALFVEFTVSAKYWDSTAQKTKENRVAKETWVHNGVARELEEEGRLRFLLPHQEEPFLSTAKILDKTRKVIKQELLEPSFEVDSESCS